MVISKSALGFVSRAGVLGLAVLAVGCTAVGPDFQRPEADTAETWLQAEDERVDTTRAEYEDWWKVFEDPALDQLIDRAYNDNLSLQVVGLRILEARAQLGFATGLKYPQSQSVGASFVRSKSSENAPPFSNLPDDVLDRIDTRRSIFGLRALTSPGRRTSGAGFAVASKRRTQTWPQICSTMTRCWSH